MTDAFYDSYLSDEDREMGEFYVKNYRERLEEIVPRTKEVKRFMKQVALQRLADLYRDSLNMHDTDLANLWFQKYIAFALSRVDQAARELNWPK